MATLGTFQQQIVDILGLSEGEISPLSQDQEHSLYERAFDLYERQDYRSAAPLFTQLVLTNPFEVHYWRGLASAKQMTHDYMAAVHAWGLVALLEEDDPLPHFHAAECLLHVEEVEDAQKAIHAALERCDEGDPLIEKVQQLKAYYAH